ncbi:MAG: hypothetical protein JW717_04025 [Marinilabiliaceae bacterium]|nr:hypothetical protein [Marinilabiliaceae bacterium]
MKNRALSIGLFILFAGVLFAQKNEELFSDNNYKYYWFGIDYSGVQLIGDFYSESFAGKDPHTEIRDRYFIAWNNLIKAERKKYSIERLVNKASVIYDTDVVDSINKNVLVSNLSDESKLIMLKEDLAAKIKSYNFKQSDGIGVIIFADVLNKTELKAIYELVYFNIKNRELLYFKQYEYKPMGFGIRNYWAGSFYPIFRDFPKYEFENKRRLNSK